MTAPNPPDKEDGRKKNLGGGICKPIYLEHNGEKRSIRQWAKYLGIDEAVIRRRLKKGLPLEQVLVGALDITKKSTVAAQIKDKVTRDILYVYHNYGRQRFAKFLRDQFDEDPGRAMKEFVFPMLPKESICGDAKRVIDQPAQIHIELVTPPPVKPQITFDDGGEVQ